MDFENYFRLRRSTFARQSTITCQAFSCSSNKDNHYQQRFFFSPEPTIRVQHSSHTATKFGGTKIQQHPRATLIAVWTARFTLFDQLNEANVIFIRCTFPPKFLPDFHIFWLKAYISLTVKKSKNRRSVVQIKWNSDIAKWTSSSTSDSSSTTSTPYV